MWSVDNNNGGPPRFDSISAMHNGKRSIYVNRIGIMQDATHQKFVSDKIFRSCNLRIFIVRVRS